MEFPMSMLNQNLADFLLPFFRISALIMTMAGLGAKNVPARIKLMFSIFLAIAVMPGIPKTNVGDLFSFATILLVAEQLIIGVMIGLVSIMVLNTFILAGQVVAMQTGLGFASLVDPASGTSVPAVGQFFLILATLIFWAIDGHLTFILFIVHSFDALPIPLVSWDATKFNEVAQWGGWMFATALSLALAPLTAMLLINFAFGIMTRAAPQLNIFAIGFPITMTAGLIIMWLTMSNFLVHFELQWDRAMDFTCHLLDCGVQ